VLSGGGWEAPALHHHHHTRSALHLQQSIVPSPQTTHGGTAALCLPPLTHATRTHAHGAHSVTRWALRLIKEDRVLVLRLMSGFCRWRNRTPTRRSIAYVIIIDSDDDDDVSIVRACLCLCACAHCLSVSLPVPVACAAAYCLCLCLTPVRLCACACALCLCLCLCLCAMPVSVWGCLCGLLYCGVWVCVFCACLHACVRRRRVRVDANFTSPQHHTSLPLRCTIMVMSLLRRSVAIRLFTCFLPAVATVGGPGRCVDL
jgi:hypothetical protein